MKQVRSSFSLVSLAALLAISCGALLAHAHDGDHNDAAIAQSEPRERAVQPQRVPAADTAPQRRDATMVATNTPMRDTRATSGQGTDPAMRGEQARTAAAEQMRMRMINVASHLSSRMEILLDRFANIIARLESRIAKLEAAGVDTTAAQAAVDGAKEHLADARGTLGSVMSIASDSATENPREVWQEVRTQFTTMRDSLREAREALREAVAALKEAIRATNAERGVSDAVRNSASDGAGNATTSDEE